MINPEQFLKDYNEFLEYYGNRAAEYFVRKHNFNYPKDMEKASDYETLYFRVYENNIEFYIWESCTGVSEVTIAKDKLCLHTNLWKQYLKDTIEDLKNQREKYAKVVLKQKHEQYKKLKKELGYES